MKNSRVLMSLAVAAAFLVIVTRPQAAHAYIENPYTLGRVINESTNIVVLRVEKVEKTKNLILYSKVEDIKGKHPTEVVKHNISHPGHNPRERAFVMEWADPGKIAVMFHNTRDSEIYIG